MNIYNEKVRFTKADWSDFFRSDYVSSKSGETFSEVLTRYLDEFQSRYGVRQQNIANATGISSTLIKRYRTAKTKPSLYNLVMLCIAMRLIIDRSEYLLYTAGYVLNNSTEHRIYKLFLNACAFDAEYSANNCKKALMDNHCTVE